MSYNQAKRTLFKCTSRNLGDPTPHPTPNKTNETKKHKLDVQKKQNNTQKQRGNAT